MGWGGVWKGWSMEVVGWEVRGAGDGMQKGQDGGVRAGGGGGEVQEVGCWGAGGVQEGWGVGELGGWNKEWRRVVFGWYTHVFNIRPIFNHKRLYRPLDLRDRDEGRIAAIQLALCTIEPITCPFGQKHAAATAAGGGDGRGGTLRCGTVAVLMWAGRSRQTVVLGEAPSAARGAQRIGWHGTGWFRWDGIGLDGVRCCWMGWDGDWIRRGLDLIALDSIRFG